jgi:hypothetical protein
LIELKSRLDTNWDGIFILIHNFDPCRKETTDRLDQSDQINLAGQTENLLAKEDLVQGQVLLQNVNLLLVVNH